MAVTQNSYTGDNSTTNYSFTFPYLKTSDIKCSLDAVVTTAFSLANATTVQFNTAPGSGVKIKIYRETADDSLTATFYAGSSIKSEDLNDNFTQNLYTTQEVNARFLSNLGGTMVGNLTMDEDADIVFEGATANAHETTITVEDPTADRTITFPNNTGTVVTTGSTLAVSTGMIADSAITSGKIENNTIVDADISTTAEIAVNKLEHGINNQILQSDNSGNVVWKTNVQLPGNLDVNTNTTVGGTLGIVGTTTAAAINASGAVGVDGDFDVNTNKFNITAASGNTTIAGTLGVTGQITGNVTGALTGNSATATALATGRTLASTGDVVWNSGSFDGTANVTGSATIQADAVTYAKMQNVSATSKVLGRISSGAGNVEELSAANIKTIYESNSETNAYIDSHNTLIGSIQGTTNASQINKLASYTGTGNELNVVAGKTFRASGDGTLSTTSDTEIPSSKVIAAHITASIEPLGGFEAIANEDSFPATNPAAGVIISIADTTGITVDSSGVSDTCRQTGSGSDDVRITDFPTTLRGGNGGNANPFPLPNNTGLLVVATGTQVGDPAKDVYTFHRLLPTSADVKQLSDDVNDFFARYRIENGEPGSNNDDGDLVWDTNSNKMKVYNSTAGAWEEITSTGDFKLLTVVPDGATSGSPVFNGSNVSYDLRDGSNAASISNIGQLLVSLNGVIQKPNSGSWSASNEGFHLEGSNGIKFCTAPAADSSLFVTQIGTAVTLNHPADDSVDADAIDDGAILNIAINSSAAIEGSKLDNPLQFPNNHKVGFGANNDLELYHTGTDAAIDNNTGDLYILTTGSGDDIVIEAIDDVLIKCQGGEDGIKVIGNGAVELHNNGKKTFETFVNGVIVRGGDDTEDGEIHLYADRGDDNPDKWRIIANASASRLRIQNYHDGAWETNIEANSNEGVKLDYNNLTTFETRSDGIKITGANNSYAVIEFNSDNGDDNDDVWLQYAGSDGNMYWQSKTSGSFVNKLKLNSNGNLGIGTTDTYDAEASNLVLGFTGHGGITVASTEADKRGNLYFADATTGTGAYAGGFSYDHNIDKMLLRTGSLVRMEWTNDGNVEISDGDLLMGATGHGINFSAAQTNASGMTSETLDSYEEGTWTPTFVPDNNSFTSITYTSQSSYYTKVGRTVNVWLRLAINAITVSPATGAVKIHGLPFTAANGTGVDGATLNVNYYTSHLGGLGDQTPSGYVQNGNTTIVFGRNGGGSAFANIAATDLSAGLNMYAHMTYLSAS